MFNENILLGYYFEILNILLALAIILKRRKYMLIDPLIFYSIGHIIAYGFGILAYDYVNTYLVIGYFNDEIILFNKIEILALIYFLIIIFSFYIFKNIDNNYFFNISNIDISNKKIKQVGIIFINISFLLLIFYIYKKGMFLLNFSSESDRINMLKGMGFVNILLNTFLNWGIGLLSYYFSTKSILKIISFNIFVFFIGVLLFITFGGRTSSFMPLLLSIFIPLFLKKYTLKKVSIFFLVFIPFVFVSESIRNSGSLILKLDLANLAYAIKGGFAHFAGLFAILEHIGNDLEYQVFRNYKDIIVYWIPRAIYPDKPIQFGDAGYVTKTILGDDTFTMVTSNIGEWIVNLGYPGIIVGGLIMGVILRLIFIISKKALIYKNPADIIFSFYLLFSCIGFASRSGLEGFLTYLPVPLIMYFITKHLIKSKKEYNENFNH